MLFGQEVVMRQGGGGGGITSKEVEQAGRLQNCCFQQTDSKSKIPANRRFGASVPHLQNEVNSTISKGHYETQ